MAYKVFQNGYPLPASELNNYLMNQTVMVFATASARAADIPSPTEGMVTYREDANVLEVYNGSAWTDINDNTAAIPKSIIDAAGDLIVGTAADTPARLAVGGSGAILKSSGSAPTWLGVGTTGQVLTVSGGDAVWAAVPATAPTVQAFTSSGTWTVPAGITKFSAFLMAGGRGGGQGEASNNASAATGGSGGATGSYTMFQSFYCTPGDVWTVTVGAGGAGASAIVNNTSGIKQGSPNSSGSNGTASTLVDPTGNLTITTNPSTQSASSPAVGGVAVTTNMTNAFAGANGVTTVGNPTAINWYAITTTQGIGSNGTTAPNGTVKGTGGTASHSGTGGAGSAGQSATNGTTLGTAMGDYAWFGGGAGGGAAASSTSTNTVGGNGGNAAANTGGGGGGGGAAFRGSGTSSTGGAGGNGGSGFVAIVY